MSNDTNPVQTAPSTAGAGPSPHDSPVVRGMPGHHWLAVLLALLLGAACSIMAYHFSSPVYRSEGLVRIAYSLPEVLQETDQNRPVPRYDMFMQSQRLLMTSRRVIDMAIQDSIWKTMGCNVPLKPDRYFAEHLKVEVSPGSEYIAVSVTDPDPVIAAAAVTAVINSYKEFYNQEEKSLEAQRIGVLDDEQNALQEKIVFSEDELHAGEKEYGTADLGPFYDAAAARVMKLQAALSDTRSAIATTPATTSQRGIPATQPDSASTAGTAQPGHELSIPEIAASEQSLVKLLDDTKKEMKEIGAKQIKLRQQEQDLASLREQQSQIAKRISVLRGEGQLGGRLTVISTGELALSPEHDPRTRMAAVAGAEGAGIPLAFIILRSFARRRQRGSLDGETGASDPAPPAAPTQSQP